MNRLSAENVTLAYDQRVIAEQLSVEIPDNSFTVIVGPNACGKSTLLRALSRMLKPSQGRVLLDGSVIQSMPAKKVARRPGLLPRSSIAPDGSTVGDLVGRGRYPHQGLPVIDDPETGTLLVVPAARKARARVAAAEAS